MAHPDLNQLLNSLLPFAERTLAEHGEFFPFGTTMKPDGEIVAVSACDRDERPPSQSVIDLLTHAFRQQARNGDLRAAGICYDARTTPRSAVHVEDPAYQVAKIRLREARFHGPARLPYPFGVLSI